MHAILYADDILLLATGYSELATNLKDVQAILKPLDLRLALEKRKILASPSLETESLTLEGHCNEHVQSMVFLGILLGYGVTSSMTLAARTVRATEFVLCAFQAVSRNFGVSLQSLDDGLPDM